MVWRKKQISLWLVAWCTKRQGDLLRESYKFIGAPGLLLSGLIRFPNVVPDDTWFHGANLAPYLPSEWLHSFTVIARFFMQLAVVVLRQVTQRGQSPPTVDIAITIYRRPIVADFVRAWTHWNNLVDRVSSTNSNICSSNTWSVKGTELRRIKGSNGWAVTDGLLRYKLRSRTDKTNELDRMLLIKRLVPLDSLCVRTGCLRAR